ncbi:Thiolase, N-terminal domain-containing protein [Melampsora americana]|nr:Thiolase, N-terminal domain-containing protein [Melampsora americana]
MSLRSGLNKILQKSPNDIVILTALRTPIGRAYKGSLKDTFPEELLAHVLSSTKARLEQDLGLDLKPQSEIHQKPIIEDITVGTVLMELGGAKSGRLAALHAGFPYQTTFKTVNRQCSSSLQAITDIAGSIATGAISCGIAAGTESMTKNYGTRAIPADLSPRLRHSPVKEARDCVMPMGLTSEAVASTYKITRDRQDAFALASHSKAQKALEAGQFKDEIVPIEVDFYPIDQESGEPLQEPIKKILKDDEGIRSNLTLEKLSSLKPAFKSDGTSTAGNSSQISDGASAITLMRRKEAEELGLKPLARFVGSSVVGVPPNIMGVGPAFSTPVLLDRFGLSVKDIDLFELNEAFASQALMTIDHLQLDEKKVNPKGGAIAIGHPLGATGGRLVASLIHELRRTNQQIGLVTLCCGTGFGKSSLFLAE